MLSISFSEIIVIFVVALTLFGKKEIPELVKMALKVIKKLSFYKSQVKDYIKEVSNELEIEEINKQFTKIVIGEDGKEYLAYDLDFIKPDIANDEKEHTEPDTKPIT
ncbi:MAG: twin-arginine translocase TatA/TatE family subunit [Sphingobacteriia bacterium]|nr:twin-arginine translocase TatA/TatE family subunit [Sphingobacteriia bacterium]